MINDKSSIVSGLLVKYQRRLRVKLYWFKH
jgi:hypothetical protein